MAKPDKKAPTRKVTGVRVEAFGNVWDGVEVPTEQDVKSAEEQLGVKFTSGLRELLQTCASGRPAKDYYHDEDPQVDVEVGISHVLPLQEPRLVSRCLILRERTGLPLDFVPFALDRGNANSFCVRLNDGAIIYWVTDVDDMEIYVAKDLKTFLAGLETCPY